MSKPMGHPMSVVRQAQQLVAAGWPATTAARIVGEEHGTYVSGRSVLAWTNPDLAERDRQRKRTADARRSREKSVFRLRSNTDAFKEAFVERLRAERVPRSSIAKVCTVVFGEPWTRSQVCRVLGEKT